MASDKRWSFWIYNGYFFNVGDASLFSNPQFKYIVATTGTLSDEQVSQINTELESNKKQLKFTNFEIGDESLTIQFIENLTFTKLKTVYAAMDFLVELFKRSAISEQNICHSCDTKANLKYYDLNNIGVILCDGCSRKIETNYYELEREKYSEDKNYFTGFLGSFVFSIPGIIVWVLIAVYLETLASAMAIGIAALGIYGYEYFKGRTGNFTKYIIVLSNIISILVANVLTVIVMLLLEGFTISQSMVELQTNEIVKDILSKNTTISFILAFFIWIWLLFIIKEQKLTIKPAQRFVR